MPPKRKKKYIGTQVEEAVSSDEEPRPGPSGYKSEYITNALRFFSREKWWRN